MERSRTGLFFAVLLLCGCSTTVERDGPGKRRAPTDVADAVPKVEAKSKYGNPASYEVLGKRYYTLKTAAGFSQRGVASWYGEKFHGRKTSSGEVYDMYKMTAAHKGLPLPTYVEVINLDNQRRAVVKVNDRGPFHDNRVIDLSYAAALKLGVVEKGTAFVQINAIDPSSEGQRTARNVQYPANSQQSGVYLQVGAFRERQNAQALVDKLTRVVAGKVGITQVFTAGSTLHRVQIGPVMSVAAADSLVAALASIGISEHHFVSN